MFCCGLNTVKDSRVSRRCPTLYDTYQSSPSGTVCCIQVDSPSPKWDHNGDIAVCFSARGGESSSICFCNGISCLYLCFSQCCSRWFVLLLWKAWSSTDWVLSLHKGAEVRQSWKQLHQQTQAKKQRQGKRPWDFICQSGRRISCKCKCTSLSWYSLWLLECRHRRHFTHDPTSSLVQNLYPIQHSSSPCQWTARPFCRCWSCAVWASDQWEEGAHYRVRKSITCTCFTFQSPICLVLDQQKGLGCKYLLK